MVSVKCQCVPDSAEMETVCYTSVGQWLKEKAGYQMHQSSVLFVDNQFMDLGTDAQMWRFGIKDGKEHSLRVFDGWESVPRALRLG